MLVTPFITDMFGNLNAGSNVGFISLYSTVASLAAPVVVTFLSPVLGVNVNHIVGIVGVLIAVVLIILMDTDTSKLKTEE